MNSGQTITFFSFLLAGMFAVFIVWPRAGMTRQQQTSQKSQQTPTIDE